MAKLIIETNERMEVTNFFGFIPSDNPEMEDDYINVSYSEGIDLYIRGHRIANIDWFHHFWGSEPTENVIWAYILQECRKHTTAEKIFIDKFFVDEYYSPLALSFKDLNEE